MGRIVDIFSLVIVLAAIGGLFWYSFDRSTDRAALALRWIVTILVLVVIWVVAVPGFRAGGFNAIFGLVVTTLCGGVLAVVWTGSLIDAISAPLASLYDGGSTPPDPKPYYSVAIANRKRSKPLEAIIAIREQLAKFPNDYEGITLLANIQVEDLKDLPSAETTLNHFCEWEGAPPKQVAAALTQLADWHMKLFQDVGSARVAMQRIVEKYPDTDLAQVAKQRIAHLDGTKNNLLAAQGRQPIVVPEGVKNVGLLDSSAHLVPEETPPSEQAAAYVKHLEQHPDDTEAREKLAVIYAIHFKRLDLATIELEQMIEGPNFPPKRVTHWLNLLANLQVQGGADYETARATLERIVERFPDFAVAEVARTRLAHLKLEFKALEKTPEKTMGVYEQNIGLKGNRSY